jgi:hypothetical protein
MQRTSRRRRHLLAASSIVPVAPPNADISRSTSDAADTQTKPSPDRFALTALGRAGHWEVSLLESLEQEGEWFVELECDSIYFACRLTRLSCVHELLRFVTRMLTNPYGAGRGGQPFLEFGTLGNLPVRLVCDDEDAPRCLLIAPAPCGAILRWTIAGNDLEMLAGALTQIVSDLPASLFATLEPAAAVSSP